METQQPVYKKRIVPTPKQKKLATLTAESLENNKPLQKSELKARAGYSRAAHYDAFSSEGFQRALEKTNLSPTKLARVYADAFDANIIANYKGEAFETDIPDHPTRLKAATSLAKIVGLEQSAPPVTVNNISSDDLKLLLGF